MRPMVVIIFVLFSFVVSGMVYSNFTENAVCTNVAFGGSCPTNNLVIFGFPAWMCNLLPNADLISGTCANTLIDPFSIFTSFIQPSGLLFVISLVASIICLILGSGISIGVGGEVLASGGQASIGVNDSGTKFYRDLGIGFLVWGFAVAMEGGWCDSIGGGWAGLLCLMLEVIFILAIWWQAETQV